VIIGEKNVGNTAVFMKSKQKINSMKKQIKIENMIFYLKIEERNWVLLGI